MSFNFHLYRAKEGLGPINRWADLYAEPLGSVEHVKESLSELFPQIEWKRQGDAWLGFGSGCAVVGPYLDITLSEDTVGQTHFIVLDKAPPSIMRKIMEGLNLNYACAPEADTLIDPYAYDDADRYYAKRPAPDEQR
ncbi:MAG: hypothetical protein WBV39_16070 [Rudaea sp.]